MNISNISFPYWWQVLSVQLFIHSWISGKARFFTFQRYSAVWRMILNETKLKHRFLNSPTLCSEVEEQVIYMYFIPLMMTSLVCAAFHSFVYFQESTLLYIWQVFSGLKIDTWSAKGSWLSIYFVLKIDMHVFEGCSTQHTWYLHIYQSK